MVMYIRTVYHVDFTHMKKRRKFPAAFLFNFEQFSFANIFWRHTKDVNLAVCVDKGQISYNHPHYAYPSPCSLSAFDDKLTRLEMFQPQMIYLCYVDEDDRLATSEPIRSIHSLQLQSWCALTDLGNTHGFLFP